MTAKYVPSRFDLRHDRIRRWHRARRQRQRAGKVHVGGDSTKRGGTTGRLRWLGEHVGVAAGPVIRYRHVDVRVGFDPARQYDHARGIDHVGGAHFIQYAGRDHSSDLLPLDADIHQTNAIWSHHGSALDYQIQHDCLPFVRSLAAHLRVSHDFSTYTR